MSDTLSPTVSIVMPAYNEEAIIGTVIEQLALIALAEQWEIVVVNDGSHDSTGSILKDLANQHTCVKVMHHRANRGYGAALKTGIRSASAPVAITMDSDGQHTVEHIHTMLQYRDEADCVIGARTGLVHSPLWRMPGKWFLTMLAQFLTKRHIPDLNSGMRLFHRDIIVQYFHLFPDGFSFSTTSTMILLNRGYDVKFTPITIEHRVGHSTVSLKTGFQTIFLIIRLSMLLDPLRIFIPISTLLMASGIVWAVPYLLLRRGLTTAALLLLLSSILVFLFGLIADQISALRKEMFEDHRER